MFDIKIECAVPCKNQEIQWNTFQQKRYRAIIDKCDAVVYISNEYSLGCMQKRNEYMVDNSNLLIAGWNGEPSGTANTINYAKSKGIEIIVIDLKND